MFTHSKRVHGMREGAGRSARDPATKWQHGSSHPAPPSSSQQRSPDSASSVTIREARILSRWERVVGVTDGVMHTVSGF